MNKNFPNNLVASILLLTLLTSCIGFRGNKIPEVNLSDVKISPSKKLKVYTKWSYGRSFLGEKEYAVRSAHEKLLNSAIKETNCCVVIGDRGSADVTVDIRFYNESERAALFFSVLTGLSLYTIPSWINAESRVVADVTIGKKEKSYDISDSSLMIQWLPFVVVLPFRENPVKMETKMNENIYKNLVSRMAEDGFLK